MDAWVVVDEAGQPVGAVQDGDAVVIFNFRLVFEAVIHS